MSRRGYSEEDKKALRRQLREVATRLFMERGVQNVTLTEIVNAVGISKPYFYKLYPSYGELMGESVGEQRALAMEVLDRVLADDDIAFEDEVNAFLCAILGDAEAPAYVMGYDAHGHIYKNQNYGTYIEFQKNHMAHFEAVLQRLGVPEEKISVSVFGNLYMLLASYRLGEENDLVYMFSEERDATINFASKLLAEHITGLREKSL